MSSGITRDDWIKAMDDAGIAHVAADDQGAVTAEEFADMLGIAMTTARTRLRALEEAGKATRTAKRKATRGGKVIAFVAYRLVTA